MGLETFKIMGLKTKENHSRDGVSTELNCGQGKQGRHFHIITSR